VTQILRNTSDEIFHCFPVYKNGDKGLWSVLPNGKRSYEFQRIETEWDFDEECLADSRYMIIFSTHVNYRRRPYDPEHYGPYDVLIYWPERYNDEHNVPEAWATLLDLPRRKEKESDDDNTQE